MSRSQVHSHRSGRRGSMATYVMVTLPVVGMFAAFGIEVAYAHVVRQQLQGAADAAGHAALLELDGTAAGLTAARANAHRVGDGFLVDGRAYNFADPDIQFGYLDASGNWVGSADGALVTSVRIKPVEPVGLGFSRAFFGRGIDVTVCSAITTGDGNATTGVIGGAGLVNGEVAVRASKGGASGTPELNYDDDGNTVVVDLFSMVKPGMDEIDEAAPFINPTTPFKLIVVNADLSSGGFLVINGGAPVGVKAYDNTAFASLPTYALAAGVAGTIRLTSLTLNFSVEDIKKCKIHPSDNSSVTAGHSGPFGEFEGGTLAVQAVRPTATQTAGTSAGDQNAVINNTNGLLYQVQAWWQWHQAHYDSLGGHAAEWAEDYAALDCFPHEYIDTRNGGGVCL